MTFRSNDGDRDKFDHSLHHYPVNKFDRSLHYYPQKIIYPEKEYQKRELKCDSILLNGINSYIDYGNDSSLNITDELTLGTYIYTYNSNLSYLISKNLSDISNHQYAFLINNPQKIEGYLEGNTVGSSLSNSILLHKWYHLAMVYNKTDVRYYINGILSGTPFAKIDSVTGSNNTLNYGRRKPDNLYFYGLLKHFYVYSRDLSATEVLNISRGIPVSNNGLELNSYIKTNHSADTTIKDLSGNDNDGILHNCTWNCDWIKKR